MGKFLKVRKKPVEVEAFQLTPDFFENLDYDFEEIGDRRIWFDK